ncbi:MAG: hypothetical protein AB7I79_15210 [Rhizobiaceae bacterium]
MKIASGVIGLLLGFAVMLQSCVIATGGNIIGNQTYSQVGSVGVLVGFLTFLGGAFGFGLPLASTFLFGLGVALATALIPEFPDMLYWALANLALTVLAFYAWWWPRELARRAVERAEAPKP